MQFLHIFQQGLRNRSALNYSEECVNFIMDWSRENLQRLQYYLELSGHGVNQLGSYDGCLGQPNSTYYLCLAQQPAPGFIGICFSDKCTSGDIKELSQTFETFKFTDVLEPSAMHQQMPIAGYVTLSILGILVLLTLISTILVKLNKHTKRFEFIAKCDYFSLQRSVKVFRRSGQIKFLNGIKSICFLAVVFGHELFLRIGNMQNIINLQYQLDKFYITLALSYIFAVDVFFYLGGFMVGFLFLKQYYRKRSWKMFPLTILQRYLRLAPLFAICMFIYWKVMPSLGSGPLYYQYMDPVAPCADTFWKDLLFVGNFSQNMCMVWGWYIQIDMQLFVVSLMLLWLYAEVNKKVFAGVTVATMIGTIVYCFVRCQTRDYHVIGNLDGANNPNSDKYYLDLYNKPWSRTGPYFLGLCVGIYYYNYTERKHAKEAPDRLETAMRCRLVRWFCFVAGLALVCVITYAPRSLLHQIQWTQFENSLYLSMGRISYSFGVCLMTLPMLLGYSNPLQTFLEWDILQFMSKLAFSCYLIHYAILTGFILDVRTSQYVNPQLILINGIAHLGPILVAGLILSLAVELPLGAICDSLLGRKRTSSHKKQRSD